MIKLLITGAAGFIGSNFVKYMLQDNNFKITALDALTYAGNLDNFESEVWNNKKFYFIHGSILDRAIIEKAVSKVDMVVHFAAETHVDNSIYNTDDFVDTDIKGTQILLDAIRKHPVERFIHISTSEVYGTAEYVPMDESHPLNPRSPYASAKAGADRIVYSYYCTFGLPVVILRPFNNYGPNQHIEKLVPCFTTLAIQNKGLPLHGSGRSTRDWLFVKDTCKAVKKSLMVNLKSIKGEAINIGTGKERSVTDTTRIILQILNKPMRLIKSKPDRPGQVERHRSCTKKAKDLLDWTFEISLKEGLTLTVDWYLKNRSWWKKLKKKHDG